MIKYKVEVSPEFKKEFYKLEMRLQKRVKKILYQLQFKLIGIPLRHDLSGFYSVHFEKNKYRLIYTKIENLLRILALHVGKRTKDFYKKFAEDLKRRSRERTSEL